MHRSAAPHRVLPRGDVGPRPRRWRVLVAAAVASLTLGCGRPGSDTWSVSLDSARADAESGRALLVDIREPDEHALGVAPGAKLLPARQLAARLDEIPADPSRPVLLICATQNRSRAAQALLHERGYGHVRYVQGGMSEWARRGWPRVKPAP
jgi:rhodanese-related sulfurtransferase